MRVPIVIALAVASATAICSPAFGDTEAGVGNVQIVRLNAYGTPPNAPRVPKRKGDIVIYRETLETLKLSGLLVRFDDGSKLTLGASSKVLVDDFVYAPGDSASKALISVPIGAMRYLTGSMPKGNTVIDTPTATLTLRGTDVGIYVDISGNTRLVVHEGKVDVLPKTGGPGQSVEEGNSVVISQDGIDSTRNSATGDHVVDSGFGNDASIRTERGSDATNHNTVEHQNNDRGDSDSGGDPGGNTGGGTGGSDPGGGSTGGTGGCTGSHGAKGGTGGKKVN
jgi:uncharacterized membrane protein YgcG